MSIEQNQLARSPHASLDPSSRMRKAEKISRLLRVDHLAGPLRVLEIGCGSGVIANYFANLANPACEVFAVDVNDQRITKEGYQFSLVRGCELPFDSGSFDLVISNHVIEHVGDRAAQVLHLVEIARVLTHSGSGYLAAPNRWAPVEPHYHLPFLSWLPKKMRSPYLGMSGKGKQYDCNPLSAWELARLFAETGLVAESLVAPAVRELLALEATSKLLRIFVGFPPWLLTRLSPWSPTLIFQLRKQA